MLIKSHRHTKSDLDLWSDYHASDLMWAETESFRRKCLQSQEAIKAFAADGEFQCCISWGKDSVAATHMMLISGVNAIVTHAVPSNVLLWQDRVAVRDEFLHRFPCSYHEVDVDYAGLTDDQCIYAMGKALRSFSVRYMTGIAKRESLKRRFRSANWGISSPNTCAPLNYWSSADVFAYLAAHNLPISPVYAMLGGGRWPRDRLRVDDLTGGHGTTHGRSEWETEYYGDILRRNLKRERFP